MFPKVEKVVCHFSLLTMSLLVFEEVADRVDDKVGDHCVEDEVHDQCSFLRLLLLL